MCPAHPVNLTPLTWSCRGWALPRLTAGLAALTPAAAALAVELPELPEEEQWGRQSQTWPWACAQPVDPQAGGGLHEGPRGSAQEGSWAKLMGLHSPKAETGVQRLGFQLNSPTSCCVTLGMLLALSEPQLQETGH